MLIKWTNIDFISKNANLSRILRNFCSSVDNNINSHVYARSFDDIPGPRGFMGLGNLYQYLPGIGKYSFDALHKSGFDKYLKYGSIVRETMVPGTDIVWLYDPDDIATVLNDKMPGHYPSRRSHTALEKYRKDRPQIYRTAGLLPTNGSEWWKIRSELQKGLSSPQCVRSFLKHVDKTTQDFVKKIKPTQNFDDIPDFLASIERLNLELLCLLVFDINLDAFSEEQMDPNSMTSKLMESAEITNSCILPTDQGFQLWRFLETPTYKKLKKAQGYMEKVAIDLVSEKLLYFDESPQKLAQGQHQSKSLLEDYLKNPNLELNDIIGMAADLLLAGVHTTAYTTSFLLYHLALNPEKQEKLYNEARRILPNSTDYKISPAVLNTEVPFARAVLKETMRMNPISIGVGRILNKDTVLSGFIVPKETIVVTQNLISCRLDTYFSDPGKFIPERWLRENKSGINPYLVLPFGHGMRSCIARRLAEQNMLVLMLRLIRAFKVEWAGSIPMDIVTKLINQPDQPIKIVFRSRK